MYRKGTSEKGIAIEAGGSAKRSREDPLQQVSVQEASRSDLEVLVRVEHAIDIVGLKHVESSFHVVDEQATTVSKPPTRRMPGMVSRSAADRSLPRSLVAGLHCLFSPRRPRAPT